MTEKPIGKVTSYFSKAEVAAIDLTDDLRVGDKIHIKGNTTDFEQVVKSMQIDRVDVEEAGDGDAVGIKVKDKARQGDIVYKG